MGQKIYWFNFLLLLLAMLYAHHMLTLQQQPPHFLGYTHSFQAMQSSEEDSVRGSKGKSLAYMVELCERLATELYQLRPSVKFIESKLK